MIGETSEAKVTIIGINMPAVDTGQLKDLNLFIKTSANWSNCKWIKYFDLPCDGLTVEQADSYLDSTSSQTLKDVSDDGSLFTLTNFDFKPQYIIQKDIIKKIQKGKRIEYLVQWGSLLPSDFTIQKVVDEEIFKRFSQILVTPIQNKQFSLNQNSFTLPDFFPDSVPFDIASILSKNIIDFTEKNESGIFVFGNQTWKYHFIFSLIRHMVLQRPNEIGPILVVAKPSNVPSMLSCYKELTEVRVIPFIGTKENLDILAKDCIFPRYGTQIDHDNIFIHLFISTVSNIEAYADTFRKLNFQFIITEENNIPGYLNSNTKFLITDPNIYESLSGLTIDRSHLFDISDNGVAEVNEEVIHCKMPEFQKAAYLFTLSEFRTSLIKNHFFDIEVTLPSALSDVCLHPFLNNKFRKLIKEFDKLNNKKTPFNELSGKTEFVLNLIKDNPMKRIALIVPNERQMKPLVRLLPTALTVSPSSSVRGRIDTATIFNRNPAFYQIILTSKLRVDLGGADFIVVFNTTDFSDWNRYSQFSLSRGSVRLIRLLSAGTHEHLSTVVSAPVENHIFRASLRLLGEGVGGPPEPLQIDEDSLSWSKLFAAIDSLGAVLDREDLTRRKVSVASIVEELRGLKVAEDIIEKVTKNLTEASKASDDAPAEGSPAQVMGMAQVPSMNQYQFQVQMPLPQELSKRTRRRHNVYSYMSPNTDFVTLAELLQRQHSAPTVQANVAWAMMQKAYQFWLSVTGSPAMRQAWAAPQRSVQVPPAFAEPPNFAEPPIPSPPPASPPSPPPPALINTSPAPINPSHAPVNPTPNAFQVASASSKATAYVQAMQQLQQQPHSQMSDQNLIQKQSKDQSQNQIKIQNQSQGPSEKEQPLKVDPSDVIDSLSLLKQVHMMSQEDRRMFQHVTAVRMRSSALYNGYIINDLTPPWHNPYYVLENDRRYDDLITNRNEDLSFAAFDRSVGIHSDNPLRAPSLPLTVASDEYLVADAEGKIAMITDACLAAFSSPSPADAQNYAAMRVLIRWMPNFGVRALDTLFPVPPEVSVIARAMLFGAWLMLEKDDRSAYQRYVESALADINLGIEEAESELGSIAGCNRVTIASLLFYDHALRLNEFVSACAFADQLYTVAMCLTRCKLPPGYICGPGQALPNFWGPSEDFQLLHALASFGVYGFYMARRSDQYMFGLLEETAQPSERFVRERAMLLVNELFVYFGYRAKMEKLGNVSDFRKMNPEYFEQPMTRMYAKRAIRALSLFGFPSRFTSEENCLRTLQKVANLTFVRRQDFDDFIVAIMQRMGFRTSSKPTHPPDVSWIPDEVIDTLLGVIEVLDEVRTLNRKGEEAMPHLEAPPGVTWSAKHDLELVRVTADFGLLSVVELSRRLGSEESPEDILLSKFSEAKTLTQASPRSLPELNFTLSVPFRLGRLREIVRASSK